MKGKACSWADMRKIKKILAEKDRLEGQYAALIRCAKQPTRSAWGRIGEIMEAVSDIGSTKLQPAHALEIARGVRDKASWAWWVQRCDRERWTVKQLREAIKKSRGAVAPDTLPAEVQGIHHCDFRTLELPDASVDLIFTDPPYDRDSVPLYGDMANIAARVLRPGGSLLC